jgi:hypothetical protein
LFQDAAGDEAIDRFIRGLEGATDQRGGTVHGQDWGAGKCA